MPGQGRSGRASSISPCPAMGRQDSGHQEQSSGPEVHRQACGVGWRLAGTSPNQGGPVGWQQSHSGATQRRPAGVGVPVDTAAARSWGLQ